MVPLRTSSAHTAVDPSRQGASPDKELRISSPNPPLEQANQIRRGAPDDAASSTDDDSQKDPEREIESEVNDNAVWRKFCKYKRRNKELSEDFREQRIALLGLQHDYAVLKLELAEAKSKSDCKDMNTEEAIASRDLKLLELVRERDDLTHQLKELKLIEARLKSFLQRKDSRLVRLVEERDSIEQELKFTTKERDNALRQLKRLGRSTCGPDTDVESSSSRWRLLRRCFVSRGKRETPVERTLPVNAIVVDSIHSR